MSNHHYYAFFDVDETILRQKTMLTFLSFFCRKKHRLAFITGPLRYFCFKAKIHFYKTIKSREFLNMLYYQFYKNVSCQLLNRLSVDWYTNIQKQKNLFNEKVVQEIKKHQEQGAGIVLISGSFFPCLTPIQKTLKADYVIGTNLEKINDCLTGKIILPQTIGDGKAEMIQSFLKDKRINLKDCFAYGDHISDLPMLFIVGNPVVVGNDMHLLTIAKQNAWTIIS